MQFKIFGQGKLANKLLTLVVFSILAFSTENVTFGSSEFQDTYTIPIISASMPVYQISRGELWAIFTLTITRWESGQRIIVVLYPSDNTMLKAFTREYFGMNSFRFQEMVESKVNTGRAFPPIVVGTEQEMMHEVENKPGSIGFVRRFVILGVEDGVKRVPISN